MDGPKSPLPSHILSHRWLNLELPVDLPPALVVDFDARLFDRCAFARFDIVLPISIEVSVPRRQAEFFSGRWAAQCAIERLGIPPVDIPIETWRAPRWPSRLTGSITHGDSFAAAIVAPRHACTGVGLDIERIIDGEAAPALLLSVVNDREADVLRESALPWLQALTLAFSVKESFFKGAYATVGRFFDFDAVRVVSIDDKQHRVELSVAITLAPALPRGRIFSLRYSFLRDDVLMSSFAW